MEKALALHWLFFYGIERIVMENSYGSTAIVNAEIITPLEIIKNGMVLIEKGRIKKITRDIALPAGVRLIDAERKILCPGFIDLHLQGGGGADVMDGTFEAINRVSVTHAKYGTTSFLATTSTGLKRGIRLKNEEFMYLKPIVQAIKRGTDGARILGVHIEGPFINPRRKGMIKRDFVINPDVRKLRAIIETCEGRLSMMTIAPELEGSLALIKELVKKGIIASLGHTDATYDEATRGISAGINHVTHFFNAMSGLHHRQPGATGACFDSDVSVQLIADLVHVHPAVIKLIMKAKCPDKIALITDAIMAVDMPDGIYEGCRQRVIVKNGVVRGKGGLLAGSTLTMNRAIRSIVSLGFSLQDAIRMASLTPAKILKIENKKGIIKEGMDADLTLIDDDINVHMTMVEGRVVWNCKK